ncbi:unnamed protein product, partial [Ectocarpus sp. 8 AP-2014]
MSVCNLPSNQREQLQLMAVMASGVAATSEMLANLWDQLIVTMGGGRLAGEASSRQARYLARLGVF